MEQLRLEGSKEPPFCLKSLAPFVHSVILILPLVFSVCCLSRVQFHSIPPTSKTDALLAYVFLPLNLSHATHQEHGQDDWRSYGLSGNAYATGAIMAF